MLVLNALGDRLVDPDCSAQLAHRWQLPLVRHPTQAGHDLPLDARSGLPSRFRPGWRHRRPLPHDLLAARASNKSGINSINSPVAMAASASNASLLSTLPAAAIGPSNTTSRNATFLICMAYESG